MKRMQRLRALELTAWVTGLVLLVTYGGMRAWSAYQRAEGIATIGDLRARSVEIERVASAVGVEPDTSLWSPQRVAAWHEAGRNPDVPAAVLRIPSLRLVVPIYEGTSEFNLNRGAGRIEGTAKLWSPGNLGLAAHRDGYFRVLKDAKVGDPVYLEGRDRTAAYRIVRTQIVQPHDVHVLAPTAVPTITLVTCYPFYFVGSAPQRFIVHAQTVDSAEPT